MGVTYLLDTHVFLWLLGEPSRVPSAVVEAVGQPRARLLVAQAILEDAILVTSDEVVRRKAPRGLWE